MLFLAGIFEHSFTLSCLSKLQITLKRRLVFYSTLVNDIHFRVFSSDNPAMAIVRANNTNKVAFFQYNHGPRDNKTLSGQQFLFSTDKNQRRTPVFPTAGIVYFAPSII